LKNGEAKNAHSLSFLNERIIYVGISKNIKNQYLSNNIDFNIRIK
jgi:hypothetical protein